LAISPLPDQATETAQRLQGVWQLLRWEIAYSDGRPSSFPYGEDAIGLIQYTHDGGMAGTISRRARPRLSGESVRSVPEAERLGAFESYFSYAGSYETRVHQGQAQVVHQVDLALNPNFVGSQQVRNVDFDADGGLTLSASDALPGAPGVMRHHRLIWRRKNAS
jgi:hypothetical protein